MTRAIRLIVCVPALLLVRPGPAAPADDTLPVLRGMIEQYTADRGSLGRFYAAPMSVERRERMRRFHGDWRERLDAVDFESLDLDGRIDHVLFRNELEYQLQALDREAAREAEVADLLPFAPTIVTLQEARQHVEPIEPDEIAAALARLSEVVDEARKMIEQTVEDGSASWEPTVAYRAAGQVDRLRRTLRDWYRFYDGYDPLFTWWVRKPYEKLEPQLEAYAKFLRKKLVGLEDDADDPIVGDPIGRDDLIARLEFEMIPYTPEELLAIAEREYAWCRREMLRASNDLGFGDDWHAALDHVKSLHVDPGEQPEMIRGLAWEAIEFLETRDLVTIPPVCRETWRMDMMSPARQKVSPYFLGGESIIVSFPTAGMDHPDKLMSMRGNNVHFSRATVHHELIPGHHLQGFMTDRHRTHRRLFSTPFWIEGWALYWEMLLWDLGFPQSAENRIGMLFWRTHRCARIVFSLSFHLGEMTAAECIDYLVENVGHERNNATAEVRRSVSGAYGPLYQAAYMLGGLQVRALRRELVDTGRMTDRQFHDAILQQNSIPIEMVRAALRGEPPAKDHATHWRFFAQPE